MKDVLITGASGGMGRATAELFARKGYRVFSLDRRASQPYDNIIPIVCDVTDEESLLSAVNTVFGYTRSLFAVIHFAGIYMLDSLVEMTDEAFRRIMDVNLRGAFLVNRSFMPFLTSGSRIVITTSELAVLDPLPFTGIYAVSKAALDKYAFSLRMELQLLGIDVSVLRAGAVTTDMLGVSTSALDRFTENTKLYTCNAERFRNIVGRVEARSVPSEAVARKVVGIAEKRHPGFAYCINRNPLLLLLGVLPKRIQLFAIRRILKK